MQKIWTKTVIQHNKKTGKFEFDENESQYYLAEDTLPITRMKGGFFGGRNSDGGGGGGTTVVNKTDPWAGQQPYLQRGFSEIQSQFLDTPPPAFYPGNTVVPFSQDTTNAQNMILANANTIPETQTANTGLLNRTLNGDYLYGGEGFNKALEAANNKITPMVNSTFESKGRGGSGLADVAKTSALGDAFASQYGQERQNQMNAAQIAPLAAGTYARIGNTNIDRLANVGNQVENLNQENIQQDLDRYNYNSNARRNAILQYMNAIQGNYGSTSTTNTPQSGPSGFMRYLLGAAGGAAGGGAMGGLPGAGIGGVLGLLSAFQ